MSTRAEDGYVIVYPDEDSQWTGADIIGELMAGSYAHGAWVKIHGVDMRLGGGSYSQNVWYIHPPGEPDPVEAVNVQAFQTASDLEEYLKNLDPTERSD
jgi:hypothetical protein